MIWSTSCIAGAQISSGDLFGKCMSNALEMYMLFHDQQFNYWELILKKLVGKCANVIYLHIFRQTQDCVYMVFLKILKI